jgi:hypothetical protein
MNMRFSDSYGPGGYFPVTAYSAIRALSSTDTHERKRAMELLVSAYWQPLYKYSRIRWRMTPDDAADLVQSFLVTVVEKDFLADYDRAKARFRTFVRLCLDRFAANEERRIGALKRGGDATFVPLDFAAAEQEFQTIGMTVPSDVDTWFDREWARQLFALAIERLRTECDAQGKGIQFRLFAQYDLADSDSENRVSYNSLSQEHGVPITDVTNYLAAMRRRFRSIVLEFIRELTASDEEYREEVRALLGITV